MTSPEPASAHGGLQPGRLWSLWDMTHNFSFYGTHRVLEETQVLVTMSRHNMRTWADPSHPKSLEAVSGSIESAQRIVKWAEQLLSWLKSDHIDRAVNNMRHWAEHEPHEWSELNLCSRVLRDTIKTELNGYLFYQYPKAKGEKLRTWKADWEPSLKAFPSIEWDVFAATDCYALAHSTASVFHSMRVAEIGLRAIAHERQLTLPKDKPIEWGTWQEIIKELDDEIKRIGLREKAGGAKDKALAFYSGARADLNGFKDEYRNLVSHVRENYDEHQALRALANVRGFMNRLAAAKLDYTYKPIDWGF